MPRKVGIGQKELCRRQAEYPISFNRFMHVGFPFMLSMVGIGSIVLMADVMLRDMKNIVLT